jgi:hypothetical protein
MRSQTEYYLSLASAPDEATAGKVLDLAWRFDFASPGFCLLEVRPGVDSHTLRLWMVALKLGMSEISVQRGGKPFLFASMTRFDQQETTKFHLDGAPAESMLILGYEPSNIQSRLFLADYTRASFDLGITPQQFLSDFNPMYKKGEDLLAAYVTELPHPKAGQSHILVINNSSLPFTRPRNHPLGVMHKAIIVTPNEAERRIVNSSMLITEGDELSAEEQEEFIAKDKISHKT